MIQLIGEIKRNELEINPHFLRTLMPMVYYIVKPICTAMYISFILNNPIVACS